MNIITEIVTLKTAEGVFKDDFIEIVDGLEKNFHSLQFGFIDTELLYDDTNDEWVMLQHGSTMDSLKAASKKMFQDSAAEEFVKSLIPGSVKMRMLPQVKTWRLE